ncbi:MAG: DUF6701 domain-containing protein, partial [Noviherbaspirillum sp.]
ATNAGTTGAPIFKAGSDKFALTASTISGYTGTLKINNAAVAPVKHAAEDADPVAGVLAPSSFPAAISGTPSSTATGAAFTYSEVGTFVLAGYDPASNAGSPRGVFDGVASATECNDPTVSCENLKAATWTGVDSISAKGDCIADSYANVKDGNGKYGCNFGITQNTAFLGRFIPYRFALSGSLRNRADMAACGDSGFTYFGEQINAIFTLTAQAADATTTKNYAGVLAKLDPTDFARLKVAAVDRTTTPPAPAPQPPYLLTPRISTLGMPAGSCGTSCFAAGVAANITASFMFARAAPEGAYAKVDVGIDPADDDGVTVLFDIDTSSATNAPLTPDRGKIGRTELRYGRLRIDNAYGSELLRLPVSLEAQYWNGNAYVRNVDDDCTPLAGAKFSLSKHTGGSGGITTANMNIANVVGGDPLSNGAGKIALNAPTPAITRKGSVELRSEIPYLPGAGRETFGVYKAGPVIYVREIY